MDKSFYSNLKSMWASLCYDTNNFCLIKKLSRLRRKLHEMESYHLRDLGE